MIVLSNQFVLTPAAPGVNADNPLIGWHNLVALGNVSADTELVDAPAANLANPATFLTWRGASATAQSIIADIASVDPIDYLAIAAHNFGSAQISVTIEGSVTPGVWFELVQATMLGSDAPALFRFTPQALLSIRAVLGVGSEAPRAAVLYVGKLLTLPRRIYVGHTPITYGRTAKVTNARSESGNYLGRIVLNEMHETAVELANIPPDIYRSDIDPFLQASTDTPFFFAWRPASYPREVGYAWMTNDPQPVNQRTNGMMSLSLRMQGLA
jgi:hypothetical protein